MSTRLKVFTQGGNVGLMMHSPKIIEQDGELVPVMAFTPENARQIIQTIEKALQQCNSQRRISTSG